MSTELGLLTLSRNVLTYETQMYSQRSAMGFFLSPSNEFTSSNPISLMSILMPSLFYSQVLQRLFSCEVNDQNFVYNFPFCYVCLLPTSLSLIYHPENVQKTNRNYSVPRYAVISILQGPVNLLSIYFPATLIFVPSLDQKTKVSLTLKLTVLIYSVQ